MAFAAVALRYVTSILNINMYVNYENEKNINYSAYHEDCTVEFRDDSASYSLNQVLAGDRLTDQVLTGRCQVQHCEEFCESNSMRNGS